MKKFLTVLLVLVVAMGFVFAATTDISPTDVTTTEDEETTVTGSLVTGSISGVQSDSKTLNITTSVAEKLEFGFATTVPASYTDSVTVAENIPASQIDTVSMYYRTNYSGSLTLTLKGAPFAISGNTDAPKMGYTLTMGKNDDSNVNTLTVTKGGTSGTYTKTITGANTPRYGSVALSSITIPDEDVNGAISSDEYVATITLTVANKS